MPIRLLIFVMIALASVRPIRADDPPPKPKPISLTIEGEVDADLAPVAGKLAERFYADYPKLIARFENPARPAPRAIRVVFRQRLRVPAQCANDRIEVSAAYLRKHPEDTALLTHELTHAVQQYPPGEHGWLTEGIADYARAVYGPKEQPGWRLPERVVAKQSYRDGYGTTARFLVWLEARTPGSVDKLNRKMQDKSFKPEDFQAIAGRPLDALWDECVAAGGKEAATSPVAP